MNGNSWSVHTIRLTVTIHPRVTKTIYKRTLHQGEFTKHHWGLILNKGNTREIMKVTK